MNGGIKEIHIDIKIPEGRRAMSTTIPKIIERIAINMPKMKVKVKSL